MTAKQPRTRLLGALGALMLVIALNAPAQAGELKVESLLPQGRVERLTQVVVRFSAPMRALGDMSQDAASAPLLLDPRPAGEFRWLDPNTLAYLLDRPLEGAARVAVEVPAGARALDGARLARAARAVIETPPVEALGVAPKPGSVLGPRPSLKLTLNQPVDLESLSGRLFFLVQGRKIPARVVETPLPEWQREEARQARIYTATPREELPLGAPVELVIEPGLRPARGSLASRRAFSFRFKGHGPLRLKKWSMSRNYQGKLDPAASLILEFNNPVNPRELLKHLDIKPSLKMDPEEFASYPVRSVFLDLAFKPRRAYRVRLSSGLADSYGSRLAQGRSWTLETGDLSPRLSLMGGKGVLEAREGEPALYPLKLRNLRRVRLGIRRLTAETAVPALLAETDRAWDKKPRPLAPGVDGAVVRNLEFNPAPNQTAVFPLNLDRLLGRPVRGGLALLELRAAWPNYKGKLKEHVRRTLVQVTNLGLSLKLGEAGGAAWVTRLSDGRPLGGADLELRDRRNRVLWKGRSDMNGLARLPALAKLAPAKDKRRPWRDPQVFLLARQGDDLAFLPSSWSEDLFYSLGGRILFERPGRRQGLLAHVITQLPLYQPGQRVRFVLYLRRPTPRGLVPPPQDQVLLEARDPYGDVVHSFKGRPNQFGSLAGSLKLTPRARLGVYRLVMVQKGRELQAGSFRVASFRPPDFRVTVQAPAGVVSGDPGGRAQVQAQYLFGAPVAGGRVQAAVEQREDYFAPKLLDGYAVGDIAPPDDQPRLRRSLADLKAELDSRGRASLELPQAKPAPGFPVRVSLEAVVSDASQRAVRGGRSYLVHPSSLYLGVKAPVLGRAGRELAVELKAADYRNRPATASARVIAYRQYWETVRERGPGGFWRYLAQVRRKEVWRREIKLGPRGGRVRFTPPQAGTYLLAAEAADAQGRLTRSATYLYAAGSGAAGWRRFDDHRLEITAQSDQLAPGGKARLLIKNPFARAVALVSLERRGVRRVVVRQVSGPAPVLDIPVTADDAPNVFVGVLLVRGRLGRPGPRGLDLGRPQVRMGYVMLKVKDPRAGLRVSVTPERDEMEPGREVKALVRVTDAGGQPVSAEATLLAVDERVLGAAGGKTNYDPRLTFNQPMPLEVLTADARTQVVGQRFYARKGENSAGGGGLADALRQKFHPAVFWLAQARTDQRGEIRVSFRLPDSLTSYRIVAAAADAGRNFGLGRAVIRARRPLQILSSLPRFATVGDRFAARVLVQNLGKQPGEAVVNVAVEGLKPVGPAAIRLKLAPGQSLPASFAVEAPAAGRAVVTVRAELNGSRDAARFSFPVLPAAPLTVAAAAGDLDPARGRGRALVPLLLPAGAQPGRGGLALTLSPSAAGALRPAARAILDYPWDCLEQRMSKAAARALQARLGPLLGLETAGRRALADQALAQTVDFQTPSGGFAFWPGGRRPDPFLTAFVITAAEQIKRAGQDLAAPVKKRALDYLQRHLRRTRAPRAGDLPGRLTEAMILRTLAVEGRQARTILDSVLTRTDGLPPFGLACLMDAAHALGMKKASAALLAKLENSAEQSAGSLHFSAVDPGGLKAVMGSTLRGNGMALWALSRVRPDYPRLSALASWLAPRLGRDAFLSTQEAVFGLWGLAAYLETEKSAGPATLRVDLAGRKIMEHRFAKPGEPPVTLEVARDLLDAGQRRELAISARGGGRPLWTSRLAYAPARPRAAPVNAGFSLSRFHRALKGGGEAPALGREVECVLTLLVPQTRLHVLLHDPFPAGLEPAGAVGGAPSGEGGGPWRRRELRKSGLLLYADRLEPGVYTFRYKLRAVVPGDFVLRAARVEEMYAPEVFGASAAGRMTIK